MCTLVPSHASQVACGSFHGREVCKWGLDRRDIEGTVHCNNVCTVAISSQTSCWQQRKSKPFSTRRAFRAATGMGFEHFKGIPRRGLRRSWISRGGWTTREGSDVITGQPAVEELKCGPDRQAEIGPPHRLFCHLPAICPLTAPHAPLISPPSRMVDYVTQGTVLCPLVFSLYPTDLSAVVGWLARGPGTGLWGTPLSVDLGRGDVVQNKARLLTDPSHQSVTGSLI